MQKACLMVLAAALAMAALAQQGGGTLKGRVTDSSGAVVPGVSVSVAGGGVHRTVTTDQTGAYSIAGLPPAAYQVRATAVGFGPFEAKVNLAAGAAQTFDVKLEVALEKQEVTVEAEGAPKVSTEASNNAAALVLKGDDLDSLSDDPDDLQSDLQALAGPSAGPSGGEIYVDGFTNARLPPKASIREIRINQNPFSSEYDRLGYGRIEILTKPGTDNLHGQLFFFDSDVVMNSRNPYADNKPDFQARRLGGNVGGPLSKRASFFMDFERRDIDDNALVNAIDPRLGGTDGLRVSDSVVTPQQRTTLSPRLDYQLSQNQTLVARYSYTRVGYQNTGLSSTSYLPDQAYNSTNSEQMAQLTDTIVLSPRSINETRFQFVRTTVDQNPTDALLNPPTIEGPDFQFGGIPVGHATQNEERYELQNFTTMALGAHGLKFGLRVRGLTLDDVSPRNFNGTFLYDSVAAYQAGQPAQFLIASGTPETGISRVDVAPFFQDDWRMRPNLTVSLGLRYETQTNIHDWHDVAPRVGFAWAPGGSAKKNGKTVFRGGFGIFYDRIDESLTLSADRFNGVTEQSYLIMNPAFSTVPSTIPGNAQETIYQLQPGLRAPRTLQGALGVERQLPRNTVVSSTFMFSKGEHLLRTVNLCAPLPVTGADPCAANELMYQYQSNGAYRQTQWITNVRSNLNRNVSFFAFYVLSKAMSDTDGVSTFPSNTYDLAQDWGRSSLDIRNRFMLGGSVATKWNLRLSPFITARSGAPFNITTGMDDNGDTLFTDRPAFAMAGQIGAVETPWGWFIDPKLSPGAQIIPRNYGQSPGFFAINLRLTKTFGFGEARSTPGSASMHGGPGGRGGMHGMFSDPLTDRRFNLTFSASARNLLNSTNPGPVVGNLSSLLFGQSLNLASGFGPASGAGNRRLELGLRFSF